MIMKNRAVYILLDVAAIVISFLLTTVSRETVIRGKSTAELWYGCVLLVFVYTLVILFYQPKKSLMKRICWEEFRIVFYINFQMALLLSMLLYLGKMGGRFPRSFYIIFFLFSVIWMYMGRVILKHLLLSYYKKPENKKKLLICANEENVLRVLNKYVNSHMLGYEVAAVAVAGNHGSMVVGAVKIYELCSRASGTYLEISGDSMEDYLRHQVLDEALLSLPLSGAEEIDEFVRRLEVMGIETHLTIETFGRGEREKAVEDFGSYHVLTYSPRIFEPTELFLKRAMDVAGAIVGIIVTIAAGIFVAPAIYLESPGPVIFKQTRIGRNGRHFNIYKFRSMYPDAEARKKDLEEQNEMNGLMFKVKDDPRITKVGRFIRRTSIDELPQFFNVLKGDMSLVGTRPPTEDEFLKYEERHKRRLSLKPGITGMWQVSGRSNITDFEEVVRMDLEYIDNWSVWMDVRLLLQTLGVVFFQAGAV